MEHESNTHGPHPEIWYCGEMDSISGERCDVGFFDAYDLEDHLHEIHDVYMDDEGDLEHYAIGVRTQKYWCGFCGEVIAVDSEAPEVWEMARFTHIKDHFLGRNGPRLAVPDWEGIFTFKSDR